MLYGSKGRDCSLMRIKTPSGEAQAPTCPTSSATL